MRNRANANKLSSPPARVLATRIAMTGMWYMAFIISILVMMAAHEVEASAVASSRVVVTVRPPTSPQGLQNSSSKLLFPSPSVATQHVHGIIRRFGTIARRPLALFHPQRKSSSAAVTSSASRSSSSTKLGSLSHFFEAALIQDSDCGLHTDRFLEACRQLESFMQSVGHKQSAKDLLQNIRKMEARCATTPKERRETVLDLLEYEKSLGIHDGLSKSPSVRVLEEKSAAIGLLWIQRSLAFQGCMYSLVLDEPDMDNHRMVDSTHHHGSLKRSTSSADDDTQQSTPPSTATSTMYPSNDDNDDYEYLFEEEDDEDMSSSDITLIASYSYRPPPRRTVLASAGMRSTRRVSSSRRRIRKTNLRSIQPISTRTQPTRTGTITSTSPHSKQQENKLSCPADAALVAYEHVLEPHHGWALRNLYTLALRKGTPPTRRAMLAELGGIQLSSSSSTTLSENEREQLATAENDLRLLVESWKPIVDRCKGIFEQVDLDDTRRI